jgi:hypothetical protein
MPLEVLGPARKLTSPGRGLQLSNLELGRALMDMKSLIRCVAWALAAAVTVFTLSAIEARPTMGSSADVERFIAFSVMGGAFALGYPNRSLSVVGMMIAMVSVLEIAQILVPGRHARFNDALVKAGAAVIGVAIGIAAVRSKNLRRNNPSARSDKA